MNAGTLLPTDQQLDDLSFRAQAIYNEQLKDQLEPGSNGQIVAIHVDTRDHEVASTSARARFTLRSRHPEGSIVTLDIGTVDAYDPLTLRMLGTRFLAQQPKK